MNGKEINIGVMSFNNLIARPARFWASRVLFHLGPSYNDRASSRVHPPQQIYLLHFIWPKKKRLEWYLPSAPPIPPTKKTNIKILYQHLQRGAKWFRCRVSIHHPLGFKDGTLTGRCWYKTCPVLAGIVPLGFAQIFDIFYWLPEPRDFWQDDSFTID